jgi:2-polyprenyl-6-methoxyphenol hydroxylase-like FAD-dependent oxidoreductase
MTSTSYHDPWLVVDAVADPHDERTPCTAANRGVRRSSCPDSAAAAGTSSRLRQGEGTKGAPPDLATIRRLLALYPTITEEQVERSVVYTFNAVVADRWRYGRCLLLGDAAHMMPPFAGQGLNSGIRDAANLAWKVREVWHRRAGERLLDTYEQERAWRHVEAATAPRTIWQLRGIDVALSDRLPLAGRRAGRHRGRGRSPRGGAHPGAQPVRARQTGPIRRRGHVAPRKSRPF